MIDYYTFWYTLNFITSMMYPELFWADWYIHRTHESASMTGVDKVNFQNCVS